MSSVAEWATAVVEAGLAGRVVLLAGAAAAVWWLRPRAACRVAGAAAAVAAYALWAGGSALTGPHRLAVGPLADPGQRAPGLPGVC
jgi:hypothetical protein